MNVKIADAEENDVESLIEIYSSPNLYHNREEANWFVKSFFDYHHIKLIQYEAKVIGALFWNVMEEKHHGLAQIVDFWIDENFRRRGLGEKLLRLVIGDMKQLFAAHHYPLRKVLVTTDEDNMPARKLYEKMGFQKSAVLPDLFGRGETELIYVLTIGSS
jgi:ribosomal protein S18 acetylase RimI-like enzyme